MKYSAIPPQSISPEHEHQLVTIIRQHMRGGKGLEWDAPSVLAKYYLGEIIAFACYEDGLIHGVYLLLPEANKRVKMLNQFFRDGLEKEAKVEMNKAVRKTLADVGFQELYLYSEHTPEALERFFKTVEAGFVVENKIQFCTWRLQ